MLRPHAALQKIHVEPVWIVWHAKNTKLQAAKLLFFHCSLCFWCISLAKPCEYARVSVALLRRVVDQGVSKCPVR